MQVKHLNEIQIISRVSTLLESQRDIVFTNGYYDVINASHIEFLAACKKHPMDYLIVGINSDSAIKSIEGNGYPIHDQISRATVLCALESVDAVVVFNSATPEDMLQKIGPDYYATSADVDTTNCIAPNVGIDVLAVYGTQHRIVNCAIDKTRYKVIT